MKRVTIQVGATPLQYQVEGVRSYGAHHVLFEQDEDLLAHASWRDQGYVVAPFLEGNQGQDLLAGLKSLFLSILPAPDSFELSDYHRYLGLGFDHLEVIQKIRGGFSLRRFPGNLRAMEDRVSEICGTELTVWHPVELMQVFFIRIVRPQVSVDYNPPHRDVWLDRLRNAVNIYLPIAGSNELSSLPIVPGSHLWPESEVERTCNGSQVNGVKYQVSAVTGAVRPIQMVMPNPGMKEILVFTPYVIHGGGANMNKDQTRMSLEMRFWKRRSRSRRSQP